MNKLYYFILVSCLGGANLVYSYPFKFTNDSNFDVVFIEQNESLERKHYIKAGSTLETSKSDIPKNYIWVYVQDKIGSNKFNIKYALRLYKCKHIIEPAIVPHISYSDLEEMESVVVRYESIKEPSNFPCYIEVISFERVAMNIPIEVQDVPRAIVVPARISALTRLSVPALVNFIKEGKLTMEELREKAPEEVVEKVESYLKEINKI